MDRAYALPPLGLLDAPAAEHVSLRELLESEEFRNSTPTLSVSLGRTANGAVYAADLSAMPHLLIGGAPGSGTRTFLNALLVTLLLRCRPTDCRLLLVDSTGQAVRQFAGIPHLLAPVLTEPFDTAPALRWAVREMEQRYKQLTAAGARSIYRYNEGAVPSPKGLADFRRGKRLYHVVIVFTELASVMRYAKAEAEACIFDLSCMSRAAGIHLVVATEDLSPAVFSGMVNVSLPARISFKVSSRCDSLGMVFRHGAEQLLPRGDAFYVPPASTTPVRVHTPLVTEEEIHRVTSHWRNLAMSPKP